MPRLTWEGSRDLASGWLGSRPAVIEEKQIRRDLVICFTS